MESATANTVSTIVARDGSGNFAAGTITAALAGNATTAGSWATARTITVNGAETGSVSHKGDADATLTLAVNHNHDSAYLKLTGGTITGWATFNSNVYLNNWTFMGPSVAQFVTDTTTAPTVMPTFGQLRRAPIEALWAISGEVDHLYMAHRNGYTITSSITGVNTDSLFTYSLAEDCYVPTGSLPWVLTITSAGTIEITDVLTLVFVPTGARTTVSSSRTGK
jgi:hypothetical protein